MEKHERRLCEPKGGEVLPCAVFWIRHGYGTHKFIAAVVTCTAPSSSIFAECHWQLMVAREVVVIFFTGVATGKLLMPPINNLSPCSWKSPQVTTRDAKVEGRTCWEEKGLMGVCVEQGGAHVRHGQCTLYTCIKLLGNNHSI